MVSPFPGMDPYIEQPGLWSDFHNNLAAGIQASLNETIQPRYVARLTSYVTYDTIAVSQPASISPDVAVWQPQPPAPPGTAITLTTTTTPLANFVQLEVPLRLMSVEVRQVETKTLVLAIEILSPVNKRRSHKAFRDYQRKRRDILSSDVHLLELDLLRAGKRPPLQLPLPPAAYVIMLSRANTRPRVEVWPLRLADPLPTLPIPLLPPDPDASLDLATIFASVYKRGAYQAEIDYRQPPPPPQLSDQELQWLDDLLHQQGKR
jgi:hypothetical protein